MRAMLTVQEQTTEAILKKNLSYVEGELKNLRNLDYRMFDDAEKWLKNAKVKLDNFEVNNNNPHYIAFDMLTNAKNQQADDFMNNEDDDLLVDDSAGKNQDIIAHGEKIADLLGRVKTINTSLLAN
mmetsp:Transcript_13628/g.21332  ORF Transcript_13628/g.21332 Transcript_13628/m.21332 type:complete len:126 (-) Transcript_13628:979-1356(-)